MLKHEINNPGAEPQGMAGALRAQPFPENRGFSDFPTRSPAAEPRGKGFANVIDPKYFKHGGQCWIFKDSVYFFALNEEIVIEVRNSEIQKMIQAIITYMQDNSRIIDANELLRSLMAKHAQA